VIIHQWEFPFPCDIAEDQSYGQRKQDTQGVHKAFRTQHDVDLGIPLQAHDHQGEAKSARIPGDNPEKKGRAGIIVPAHASALRVIEVKRRQVSLARTCRMRECIW
jgi:hypothetical protein